MTAYSTGIRARQKFVSKNPALPRPIPRGTAAPWSVKCSGHAAPRSRRGSARTRLSQARRVLLGTRPRYTGCCFRPRVSPIYQAARAVVVPSPQSKGGGRAPLIRCPSPLDYLRGSWHRKLLRPARPPSIPCYAGVVVLS